MLQVDLGSSAVLIRLWTGQTRHAPRTVSASAHGPPPSVFGPANACVLASESVASRVSTVRAHRPFSQFGRLRAVATSSCGTLLCCDALSVHGLPVSLVCCLSYSSRIHVPFVPDPLESRRLLKPASGARRLNPARYVNLNRTLASEPGHRTPHPAPCTPDAGRRTLTSQLDLAGPERRHWAAIARVLRHQNSRTPGLQDSRTPERGVRGANCKPQTTVLTVDGRPRRPGRPSLRGRSSDVGTGALVCSVDLALCMTGSGSHSRLQNPYRAHFAGLQRGS